MKKLWIVVFAMVCVAGCTSREQDEKINAFWAQQLGNMGVPVGLGSSTTADLQALQEQLRAMEQGTATNTDFSTETNETNSSAKQLPSKKDLSAAKPPRLVEAMLFVSPTCPRCQRLKRDRWAAKFREQYKGQIRLTEYDLSIPKNEELLESMMRKHKLTSVSYPTLFIAGNVVQGYPLNAEPVVTKVLAKNGGNQAKAAPKQQFMEITMEDMSRVNKLKSNAPLKERQAMQRAIEQVKQSNQQALQDIGTMFGGDTQAQAFAIVSKFEKILLRSANVSTDYQHYLVAQRSVLQEQEQQLNQLMRQNAYKL